MAKVLGYKIRRKSDGLYLSKGSNHNLSKQGAVWTELHHAIASIKLKKWPTEKIMDFEIVELIEGESYSTAFILDKLL